MAHDDQIRDLPEEIEAWPSIISSTMGTKGWRLFLQSTPAHGPYVLAVKRSSDLDYQKWLSVVYSAGWHVLKIDMPEIDNHYWLFSCEWSGRAEMDSHRAEDMLSLLKNA